MSSSHVSEIANTRLVGDCLTKLGFQIKIQNSGPDIIAERGQEKWIIEVKGFDGGGQAQADTAVGQILRWKELHGNKSTYFIAAPREVMVHIPKSVRELGINLMVTKTSSVEIISKGNQRVELQGQRQSAKAKVIVPLRDFSNIIFNSRRINYKVVAEFLKTYNGAFIADVDRRRVPNIRKRLTFLTGKQVLSYPANRGKTNGYAFRFSEKVDNGTKTVNNHKANNTSESQ